MKPTFFATPADFRAWLERSHETAPELLVGFYKKGSGKPSITWPESVDEALCFGWIDGVRRSIDDESYSIRFTPRRARSVWSNVNVNRVAELTKLGRMQAAGLRAFEARDPKRSGIYAYEGEKRKEQEKLSPAFVKKFKANAKAWAFFEAQAPYYKRAIARYVMSAKKEETQLKRLARLIDDSARGRRVGLMERPSKNSAKGG
jgi:uncharacterized protein YdeI (YjbR/CyaY-like superfamily)